VEVRVGSVGIGGTNPVRVQSMTTSDTQDVEATIAQSVALAEVGCEIVRITAPNVAAARALKDIRAGLSARGFKDLPLVADIHFLPSAAMEAVEHVEKVRVNPGNYADKKKFQVREYSDSDYDAELQRLYESFSPLVKRCKELGRAMRIGTNHGSLSDRIMNRYGDTPNGMVESALEFVRIAEDHGFHDIVLSMKASNPKVMIQAYRLLVERMDKHHRPYPLHLGVTEAGDGEDGRIKSATGIGSLLLDGLGDTIRVSLTEDSVYEIPVARALADKVMSLWRDPAGHSLREVQPATDTHDSLDPFHFRRRPIESIELSPEARVAVDQPPRVVAPAPGQLSEPKALAEAVGRARPGLKDTPAEALLFRICRIDELDTIIPAARALSGLVGSIAIDVPAEVTAESLSRIDSKPAIPVLLCRRFRSGEQGVLESFVTTARNRGLQVAPAILPEDLPAFAEVLSHLGGRDLLFTLRRTTEPADEGRLAAEVESEAAADQHAGHAVGAYRRLAEGLKAIGLSSPIWIRNREETAVRPGESFLDRLIEGAMLTGALLCDGIGDVVSFETEPDFVRATKVTYNLLQGAGARISKTEFVACPSCGRTLFDLQTTTQRIRSATGHLKGVKIAIMGCIVNGPGEMADADFGYVGGAPGKINLYVGKTAVKYNIPESEAVERLIDLIREHGKWADPT
jgi:(E)-4-hydroxy-3-methylbut-2-enyl-diphosphate synthase